MYISFIVQLIFILVDEEGKILFFVDFLEFILELVIFNLDLVSSNFDFIIVGSWIQDLFKSIMWLGIEDGWQVFIKIEEFENFVFKLFYWLVIVDF